MPGAVDTYQLERNLANKTTRVLRTAVRSAISKTVSDKRIVQSGGNSYLYDNTGNAIKQAGSRSVFKNGRLQRFTIRAPHYIFKQQYGFEGTKSNGVNMRLNATTVINKALEEANILESVADEISEIRMEEVISIINFK